MLLLYACSATLRANKAPKMSPKPQLKKATNIVKQATIAALVAVLLQYLVIFIIKLLIGLLNTNT